MPTAFTPEQKKQRLDSLIAEHNIQIDREDYKAALKFTWSVHKNENGYVCLRTTLPGKGQVRGKLFKMHRWIMYRKRGYQWWKRGECMHLDGNVFNLKRDNLAIGSHNTNVKLNRRNTSGYPNVTWNKNDKKWRAQITVHGKNLNVGRSTEIEEAAIMGYEAALFYHKVEPPQKYYDLLNKQLEKRLASRIHKHDGEPSCFVPNTTNAPSNY